MGFNSRYKLHNFIKWDWAWSWVINFGVWDYLMELIQSITTTSAVTSISFTNIPQTYTHLRLITYLPGTQGTTPAKITNGTIGTEFGGWMQFAGTNEGGNRTNSTDGNYNLTRSGLGSVNDVYLLNYSNSSMPTTWLGQGCDDDEIMLQGQGGNAQAATQITIGNVSATLVAGCVFSLYGLE